MVKAFACHVCKNTEISKICPVTFSLACSCQLTGRLFLSLLITISPGSQVISFARGAAPEIIRDKKTGFLVQNLDEMVQAISHMDEIDRQDARAHVQKHFSSKAMVHNYYRLYQKLIR